MGFNRRKMEADRKAKADTEAAARRATDAQVLEDAERLIAAWNERQARHMPMLFAPTIGAALASRHWFLWVHCPVRSSCRPNAPFAQLVRLSPASIADEMRIEHTRRVLGG
jgi:hypothetical protein